MGTVVDNSRHVIVMGDLNLPDTDWQLCVPYVNDSLQKLFLTATLELNLFQYILMPTRGINVLYLIFSNVENSVVNVDTPDLISDHRIIFADFICPFAQLCEPSQSIRDYAYAGYNSFNQYLNQVN